MNINYREVEDYDLSEHEHDWVGDLKVGVGGRQHFCMECGEIIQRGDEVVFYDDENGKQLVFDEACADKIPKAQESIVIVDVQMDFAELPKEEMVKKTERLSKAMANPNGKRRLTVDILNAENPDWDIKRLGDKNYQAHHKPTGLLNVDRLRTLGDVERFIQ